MEAKGKTTQLADLYVQLLFNNPGKFIEIIDHVDTDRTNDMLLTKIKLRLLNEHTGIAIYQEGNSLKVTYGIARN